MMDDDLRVCDCCGDFIDEGRGGNYCMSCAGLNGTYQNWDATKKVVAKRKKAAKEQQHLFI